MSRQRTWLALAAWGLVAAAACRGCEGHSGDVPASGPRQEAPEMVALDVPLEQQSLRLDDRLMALAGDVDVENRYLSTVMVAAVWSEEAGMQCSGVAISRRIVLTAGHCLCARGPQGAADGGAQVLIDASRCLEGAEVETVFYKPPVEEGMKSSGSRRKRYQGTVKPHPALRLVLDEQGRVVSSRADLALIILSKPLEFPGVPLADEEVRQGDSVIIVGHEYDEVVDVFGGERRFSINKVLRIMTADSERVLIQQPGGHRYRLDSGGPCLSRGVSGPALVGISSRWLGEGAAFTSIHQYEAWLREEIQRLDEAGAVPR